MRCLFRLLSVAIVVVAYLIVAYFFVLYLNFWFVGILAAAYLLFTYFFALNFHFLLFKILADTHLITVFYLLFAFIFDSLSQVFFSDFTLFFRFVRQFYRHFFDALWLSCSDRSWQIWWSRLFIFTHFEFIFHRSSSCLILWSCFFLYSNY